jgi:pyruvate ferredoxin oxidoreductase beta subunit
MGLVEGGSGDMSWIQEFVQRDLLQSGTNSCTGCGSALGLRTALRVLGARTILVIPANCTAAIQGPYPNTAFKVPALNVAFAAAAAVASGLDAALKVRDMEDVNVVVWAGDGGTADIGLQALSGAAQRESNMIYICYDNEGYMNTGIQESGATPYGAWTTNSPRGKSGVKKDIPLIMMEHGIPYVATACASYPADYIQKLRKAMHHKGLKYIHLLSPCPPGWRFKASETVLVGKLAVETGIWALFEIEDGKFSFTGPSVNLADPGRRKPLEDYLSVQERFRGMTPEDVAVLKKLVDNSWRKYTRLRDMS